jgi:hypothetical protein
MKTTVFPHTVAFAILGLASPLLAQNLESSLAPVDSTRPVIAGPVALGSYFLPAPAKAEGLPADERPVINPQDAVSLSETATTAGEVESVVDLGVLRHPSLYRSVAAGTTRPSEVEGEALQMGLAEVSAAYRETGTTGKGADCLQISLSVEQRIKLDSGKVLEIVEAEVSANPSCSCEIVKTAIKASEADVDQTVAIVETAVHASPESMRIISQCAIAANPDAIAGVQALLARLDPNAGESGYSSKSAKDSKGAKVASITAPPLPNPLDLPPSGPPVPPIIIDPVTDVDP